MKLWFEFRTGGEREEILQIRWRRYCPPAALSKSHLNFQLPLICSFATFSLLWVESDFQLYISSVSNWKIILSSWCGFRKEKYTFSADQLIRKSIHAPIFEFYNSYKNFHRNRSSITILIQINVRILMIMRCLQL